MNAMNDEGMLRNAAVAMVMGLGLIVTVATASLGSRPQGLLDRAELHRAIALQGDAAVQSIREDARQAVRTQARIEMPVEIAPLDLARR